MEAYVISNTIVLNYLANRTKLDMIRVMGWIRVCRDTPVDRYYTAHYTLLFVRSLREPSHRNE